MPNVTQMIRSGTQKKKVLQHIVEKDYALTYLLVAIFQTDGLGDNLVLKGGTALKKLYFADYRFSEDLDYSTRVIGPVQQINAAMKIVVRSMDEMLNKRGPFQIELEPLIL
jgi:predicted nucleotidyltransferase component of viral defense system